jgi:plasmid stabilization system protein ParE
VRVVWSPPALRQVARAADYLMDFNPRAATELLAGLITAGDSLGQFPHRGRRVPGTNVCELVTAYPYIIRYRIVRVTVRSPSRPPHFAPADETLNG